MNEHKLLPVMESSLRFCFHMFEEEIFVNDRVIEKLNCLMYHENKATSGNKGPIEAFIIEEATYYRFYSKEFFRVFIDDILLKVHAQQGHLFGQGTPELLLRAIYEHTVQQEDYITFSYEEFIEWVAKESFVIFSNGDASKVLKLDLYRMTKDQIFIGGILHTFNHFSYNTLPLSTLSKGTTPVFPDFIMVVAETFFVFGHQTDLKRQNIILIERPYQGEYYRFSFYNQTECDIYFLNSVHRISTRPE